MERDSVSLKDVTDNIETRKGSHFSFSTDYIAYNEHQIQQINATDNTTTNQENTQSNKLLDMRASYSFRLFKSNTLQAGLAYYLNHSYYLVNYLSKENSTLTWNVSAAFVRSRPQYTLALFIG